jgi:hypothetical protein
VQTLVRPGDDAEVPAADNEHLDRSGGHPGTCRSVHVDRETELAWVGSRPPEPGCICDRTTQAVGTDKQPTADSGCNPAVYSTPATAPTQRNPGTMWRQFDDACGHRLKHVHTGLGGAVDEQLIEPVAWYEHPATVITPGQRCGERRSPGDVDTDLTCRTKCERSNVIEKTGPSQQADATHVETVAARLRPVPRPVFDQRGVPSEPGKRAGGATSCRTATDHDCVEVVRSAYNTDHVWSVVSYQWSVISGQTEDLLTTAY